MIKICINEKRFEQILGYGSWSLLTLGIISVLVASYFELPTRHEETHDIVMYLCYQSVLENKDVCNNYYDDRTSNRFYGSIIALIIDICLISYWINYKKHLLSFKLCERTSITNDKFTERSSD